MPVHVIYLTILHPGDNVMASCNRVVAEQERRKEMKLKLLTLILSIAAIAPACMRPPAPLQGTIEMMSGSVVVTENGVSSPVKAGDIVRKDATITTGENSFAQVAISGNVVLVYEKSSIILSGILHGATGAEETAVRVGEGTVFSRVKKMMTSRGDSFTTSSCVMVAAVRGTEFLYSVDCSKGLVATFEGIVSVRNTGGSEEILVPAGQMLTMEAGKKGTVAPIPKNFRFRDFDYKKAAVLTDGASGAGGDSARGDREKGMSSKAAGQGGRTAIEKKTSETAIVKKKESANGAAETAAVKKRTGGAVQPADSRAQRPGGLLDKPRVNLPELK
jgi:hypothetical protein